MDLERARPRSVAVAQSCRDPPGFCGLGFKGATLGFLSGRELINIVGGGFDLRFSEMIGGWPQHHSWDRNRFEVFEVASSKVLRAFHEEPGGGGARSGGFYGRGKLLAYCSATS